MGNLGQKAIVAVCRAAAWRIFFVGLAGILGLAVAGPCLRSAAASPPGSSTVSQASTSDAARRDALQSIPLDKLSPSDRTKVESVLCNVSVFRRLPIKVIDCDPDLYLFLVRHPDVVVNIWQLLKISRLQFCEDGPGQFRVVEPGGTTASVAFVYRNHNTHVLYGEGMYDGPPLVRPVKGRGVLVLKSGYVRETNDRYYVTSRMDCFLNVEPAGAEFITKTVSPLVGKTVDSNFALTLAFVSSLSRTAELNGPSVERLCSHLTQIAPSVRLRFSELAAEANRRAAKTRTSRMASRSVSDVRLDVPVTR